MNKTKKMILGLGMLGLVLGSFGLMTSSVSAYRGDVTVKGPNYSAEREVAMEKAFETNDYTAWKTLMQNRGRVTQVINKDNFAKFSEAHELAEKGDTVGAQKIRQELGLGLKNGSGQGMKNNSGAGRGNCTNR
ncbi:MAG: hypothetical protein UU10_C0036G0002 [Parcubacteria group bacterium GW2011_GWF1_40_6]|uniref:Uncharacterized protein n=2 Tax=Candidatus Nomuraibacteriota TaxID=1752729 RepID=A0A0G0TYV6_9BACT|nr:MAG: hypothetical protein UT78_C0008G0044 [Candidatus Nomurabacteria bacterium GW2011_GWF2_40_12]KKR67787.1 MAG: hypothetical protein UU10_C0036G0002 [Parcubacteria group bacterium GW2011_GWF1_40_6]OGJ09097.1 MAG: hypothetical protein A2356_01835 [Candidatus Nomurabacteria bacterium RIFOXYB1_FULL_39_16]OGJ14705.1 MAG: hypothetical protein A2585_02580 [Candidatus Nomurabacteria bacterium RIFOXYD1_FULL_39_12]